MKASPKKASPKKARPARDSRGPPPMPRDAIYISAPQVLNRYGGRSHMWLDRKLKNDPNFPRPKYFGRLRFFAVGDLEAYERGSAAKAA